MLEAVITGEHVCKELVSSEQYFQFQIIELYDNYWNKQIFNYDILFSRFSDCCSFITGAFLFYCAY